ncbi:hypothetical protein PTTG_02193 [Puccinia triticina 1-1 BBBD Race 1]|uniref:Uncharacterized protein n=1 Tax=Puccinia triticina (isolate 1-1 / race 1 (BBBD)) TaxID=630390 RepID=A0A0C4EN53_PUCT1|nr:hypothetical protein PTTG_02193 [Puccinia triticina 1-1 BBBD Race 1]WAR58198.1 hypothetical protein PtB15_5B430 [Puccinia triticina]
MFAGLSSRGSSRGTWNGTSRLRRTFDRACCQKLNHYQSYSAAPGGYPALTTIPKWLKELEKNQAPLPSPLPSQPRIVNNRQKELDDQAIIYEANIRDDFSGSPNRIGISIIGLLITSGLVANQIRHHGAGPVWSDPKSDWLDFELKLWDQSTRMFISISLITLSFVKSVKFLFTLSHTIKRITIKKTHLSQLKKLVSARKNKPSSQALLDSVPLNFYSIGALDLIYPIKRIFQFSILDSIPTSRLLRLSQPLDSQSQSYHQRSLWLKFCVSADSRDRPLENTQLNSFALQIPAAGVWGNAKFDLAPSDILSLFEEKIRSIDDLKANKSRSTQPKKPAGNQLHLPGENVDQDGQLYKLFGLDLRHSLGFNLSVLKAHLSSYYRHLSAKVSTTKAT